MNPFPGMSRPLAGPAWVDPFVAEWEERIRQSLDGFRRPAASERVRIALWALLLLVALLVWWAGSGLVAIPLALVAAGIVASGWRLNLQIASARFTAVSTLMEANDPRLVGILAETCADADQAISLAARRSLLRALPCVRQGHDACFTTAGTHALFRLLDDDDPEMLTAVLDALEQLRDTRPMFAVARIARSGMDVLPMQWPAETRRKVQAVAGRCLVSLQRAGAEAEASRALLRPADAPGDADTLLRPAQGAPAIAPEHLLRPIDRDM